MNIYDKKIFEFLEGYILVSKGANYYDLSSLYDEVDSCFSQKLYSDIHVRNQEGQTFLHLAMIGQHNKLIQKILKSGADPYLKNYRNKNSFQVSKDLHHFKKMYQQYSINHGFDVAVEGFHDNFKNFIIRNHAKVLFESKNKFNEFIYKHSYISNAAKIDLIIFSQGLNNTQKIELFLENNYTKEENTYFLYGISHKIYNKLNTSSLNAFELLLEKDFVDNNELHKGVMQLLTPKSMLSNKSSQLKDILSILVLDKVFSEKYDLTRKVKNQNYTLEEYLEKNIPQLYMSRKLNLNLSNSHQHRIKKI